MGDSPNAAPELLRPPRPGGEPERFTIGFRKLGQAALLGHLDLVRELSRVLRRAGLRIAYTQGFHPKPTLSMGPALALGIASLNESFEVKLIDAPGEAQILERLNAAVPPGLSFISVERLAAKASPVHQAVNGARYFFILSESALADLAGEDLETRISRFLESQEIVVRRDVKGIGKMVDVRSYVESITLDAPEARKRLQEAGYVGRFRSLLIETTQDAKGTARPREIAQALFGDATYPVHIVRDAVIHRAPDPTPARNESADAAFAPAIS
jgi:radical SAM-linked protein